MYKTIRHGENSLQYTILPQNDDFRLEGKIKSAGSSKKLKTKKPKRRSFFAYLGLLFVCTVIVGAVLVPFLVSAECLPNPTEWFLKTKAAFSASPATKEKEAAALPHTHSGNALGNAMLNKGNVALSKANLGKTVKIINNDGVEKIILKVNKTSTATVSPKDNQVANKISFTAGTEIVLEKLPSGGADTDIAGKNNFAKDINENDLLQQDQKIIINDLMDVKDVDTTSSIVNSKDDITIKAAVINPTPLEDLRFLSTATTAAGPLSAILLNRTLSSASVPSLPRASLQSSLGQQTFGNANNTISTQPTITTRIMQVPLLKSTAKKPAIPPVLVKNLPPIQPTTATTTTTAIALDNNQNQNSNLNDIIPVKVNTNVKEFKKDSTDSDWIHTWPYIDPATYFQWNGYKSEDSVLLPALLGFALIGVILIITVCLVARNKRTIVTAVRKRNRNDLEESGAEDNTTLLTNSNLSDED